MLQAQPELRFSAEDVLDHPWLAVTVTGIQHCYCTHVLEFPHRVAAPAWLKSSFLFFSHFLCLTAVKDAI
ncbi:hypothetical protein X777_00108 [Ooceraea biroi]|uniref:Uncharacterized protein n=1 Tax=Ooceraea biroi TaxID=2015173 RepID=A0A026VRY4_OOCBI|nr:hypothetical protein X777_00108 [Ooceraea biroi]